MICSSLCRVPFIAVLLSWFGRTHILAARGRSGLFTPPRAEKELPYARRVRTRASGPMRIPVLSAPEPQSRTATKPAERPPRVLADHGACPYPATVASPATD